MLKYYVTQNIQNNGEHEVHTTGCSYMPNDANRLYLGIYTSCSPAVREAKKYYPKSNGCFYCSNSCHSTISMLNYESLVDGYK